MRSEQEMKKLGAVVFARRMAIEPSRPKAAQVLGMKPSTLARIEHGKVWPRDVTLKKLILAYNIDLSEISASPPPAQKSVAPALWPKRLYVCATAELAAYLAAVRMAHILGKYGERNVILATNRTAAAVFTELLKLGRLPSLLTSHHYFIDTEAAAIPTDHPVGRHRAVMDRLIHPLRRRGVDIPSSHIHFLTGVMTTRGMRLDQYDAELEKRQTQLALTSVSETGELIGYSPKKYTDLAMRHGCSVVYLSEEDRLLIASNMPTTATFTIGLGNLLRAYELIVPIIQPTKVGVLQRLLKAHPDPDYPASMLCRHANVSLITTRLMAESLRGRHVMHIASEDEADRHAVDL